MFTCITQQNNKIEETTERSVSTTVHYLHTCKINIKICQKCRERTELIKQKWTQSMFTQCIIIQTICNTHRSSLKHN